MSSPEPLRIRMCPDKPMQQRHRSVFASSPLLPEDSPILRACDANALLPRKRSFTSMASDDEVDPVKQLPLSHPRKHAAKSPVSLRRVSFGEEHNRVFAYDPRHYTHSEEEDASPPGANGRDEGKLVGGDSEQQLERTWSWWKRTLEEEDVEQQLETVSPASVVTAAVTLAGVSGGRAAGSGLEDPFGEVGRNWFWAEIAAIGSDDDENDDNELADGSGSRCLRLLSTTAAAATPFVCKHV